MSRTRSANQSRCACLTLVLIDQFLACQKANLIATSQNEVITIKIPATTAASRKKLVKNVDQIEKSFSQKMIKFQTSQYVKAIEAAEESSQYSEDLEDEWAAKSLAAHVILTFEKMINSAEMKLR